MAENPETRVGADPIAREQDAARGLLHDEVAGRIRRNWLLVLALGAVLIAGGMAAIALPVAAGAATTLVIGVVLIIGAALQGWDALGAKGWKARAWSIVSALVYLIGGALLLINPLAGTIALSLALLAVFLIDGAIRVGLGLSMRPERGWGWMVGTGAASAIGAALIMIFFLPGASLTLLGAVAGVSLIFEGWAFIIAALGARPQSDRKVWPDAQERHQERHRARQREPLQERSA